MSEGPRGRLSSCAEYSHEANLDDCLDLAVGQPSFTLMPHGKNVRTADGFRPRSFASLAGVEGSLAAAVV